MAILEVFAALAAASGVYGLAIEPRRLVVRFHRLSWPGERMLAAPIRIAVLADVHAAWPHMTVSRLARIARRILDLEPSLVLLPGDFSTTETWGAVPIAPEIALATLEPLARRIPSYAVLGNHDYDYDGARVARALTAAGIRVLVNESLPIDLDGGRLWLVGLDDPVTFRHDLEAAFAGLPEDEPAILLSHSPDVHSFVPANVRLVIAGHTHGGQVCLPGFGPVVTMSRLPRRQAHGLHEVGGRHLFVTSGVGTTGLPVRFLRPPEIGLIELLPAAALAPVRLPSRLQHAALQPAE